MNSFYWIQKLQIGDVVSLEGHNGEISTGIIIDADENRFRISLDIPIDTGSIGILRMERDFWFHKNSFIAHRLRKVSLQAEIEDSP